MRVAAPITLTPEEDERLHRWGRRLRISVHPIGLARQDWVLSQIPGYVSMSLFKGDLTCQRYPARADIFRKT